MISKTIWLIALVFCFSVTGLVHDNLCSADDRSKLIEKMIKQLSKDKKPEKRAEAAKTLGDMKAEQALAALGAALQDPDGGVRWDAAYALYQVAPNAQAAIPALKQALNDSSGHVRLNAVGALKKMGVANAELIPSIRQLLQDRDPEMKIDAADTLLSLDLPITEVLPVLLEGLKGGNSKARIKASEILADYTLPVETLPALEQGLKAPEAKVRENCAKAIGKIGLAAADAVLALAQALGDPESSVRAEAASALAATGPAGKQAIHALADSIQKDRDETVRKNAMRALTAIDIDDPAALPGLLQSLKDPDKDVRSEGVDAFREMQSFPPSAVSALEQLAGRETDSTTKAHAETLLKEIKAMSSGPELSVTPRPKVAPLRHQLDAKLKDDRKWINDTQAALQYMRDHDTRYSKGEFWSAVSQGYAETVDAFLRLGMSPNTFTPTGTSRATPLQNTTMGCTQPGGAQISLILLMYGADPNVTDEIGRTPILAAVEYCPIEVVDALLMSGSKTDAVTKGGSTVLAAAVMGGKPEIVRSLLKSGYKIKNEPGYLLQSAKNAEIHRMLIKAGVK
jgi:HEAT repeat protein